MARRVRNGSSGWNRIMYGLNVLVYAIMSPMDFYRENF